MHIIALTGNKQSGKDTSADYLVKNYGYTRLGYADPLKNIAYGTNPLVSTDGTRYVDAVDKYGDDAKEIYPEVRRFLQYLGTEGIRMNIDDDFWTTLMEQRIIQCAEANQDKIVITDLRFPNEYHKLTEHPLADHLEVIRIFRPQTSTVSAHASEKELDNIPYGELIYNNQDIPALGRKLDTFMAKGDKLIKQC